MKYVNAHKVLPEKMIAELQKYIQGETLYIPKPKKSYNKWGTCSGGRGKILERNRKMKSAFQDGKSISELADEYFLSTETVKKIIYSKK